MGPTCKAVAQVFELLRRRQEVREAVRAGDAGAQAEDAHLRPEQAADELPAARRSL